MGLSMLQQPLGKALVLGDQCLVEATVGGPRTEAGCLLGRVAMQVQVMDAAEVR